MKATLSNGSSVTSAEPKTPTVQSLSAHALLNDSWRLTPARMAERLTNGRFQRWKHIRFLENKIAQAIGRGGARLLITMPPRHGKSWLASLFTPAWFLSLWPERNVILTSHDTALAESWARGVRDFLKANEAELGPRRGGEVITSAVGGPINGKGGHLLIVDDPLKSWAEASSENAREKQIEWFNSSLYTRAEPGASIIVIMTRWHQRDLAGYLSGEHGDGWEHLHIPALAEHNDLLGRAEGESLCEERFGREALERIRANVGTRAWNALYQQRPSAESGRILKRDWWKYYEVLPTAFDEVVQSWDLAFKGDESSDYVVGQVWGRRGADRYLIDQVRGKMDFPQTLAAVKTLSEKHPRAYRKLIEDKANGSALVAMLTHVVPGLIVVRPEAGKTARVHEVTAEIESGNVYLPSPELAPWVEELVTECADFPNARHDDQVDALAYALKYLRRENHNARTQRPSGAHL